MKRILWSLLILLTLVVTGCGYSTSVTDPATDTGGGVATISDVDLLLGLSAASTYSMTADGVSKVAVRAVVKDQTGKGMENVSVSFSTTKGTLTGGGSSATSITDLSGVASVELTAPTTTGNATVVANVSGLAQEGTMTFIAGLPDAENSNITVTPTTLLADGVSTAAITVTLIDANNNRVADGTAVTVLSTSGFVKRKRSPPPPSVWVDNYDETVSGRVEFDITSSTTPGTVTLSIAEYPEIVAEMTFGAVSSGNPATILVTPARNNIAVTGVGQLSQTILSLKILDDAGQGINELTYGNEGLNNLRVRFVTRPNGGEYLAGVNAANEVVDTRNPAGYIDIRTESGEVNLTLQAGTLPGNIELLVEALVDKQGNSLTASVASNSPTVVISSGPPHSIVLTTPITDSIEDLGGGVYKRIGKALVNDRWGNTVPDGTSIYLGLYDSIIVTGVASTLSNLTVTAATGTFNGSIIRNDALRTVQVDDHVIFTNLVEAQDKHRTVSAVTNATTLTVSDSFTKDYPLAGQGSPEYVVGASLSGGSIGGTNPAAADVSITGATYTKNGIANIYVTYPADSDHIMLGCNPKLDTRTVPMGHSVVGVIAKSTASPLLINDRATTIAPNGLFCFAPIAGFSVTASPAKLSSSGTISLGVRDGGDTVPVPFYPVITTITIDKLGTYGVCSKSDSNGNLIETQAACESGTPAGTWTLMKSDFKVRAYVNTITDESMVDLDGDTFNDIHFTNVGDVNDNGIPDDLNGDGVIDIAEEYLVDFGTFYSYPYSLEGGKAFASIVVTGEKIFTADAATVTFQIGDSDASVEVKIP